MPSTRPQNARNTVGALSSRNTSVAVRQVGTPLIRRSRAPPVLRDRRLESWESPWTRSDAKRPRDTPRVAIERGERARAVRHGAGRRGRPARRDPAGIWPATAGPARARRRPAQRTRQAATSGKAAMAQHGVKSDRLRSGQDLSNLLQHLVARKRLGEKVGRDGRRNRTAVAGDADHLEVSFRLAKLLRELGAAHVGHAHVGQQQVDGRGVMIENLHAPLHRCGLEHGVAGARQRRRKQLPHRRLVFHEQNRFLCHVVMQYGRHTVCTDLDARADRCGGLESAASSCQPSIEPPDVARPLESARRSMPRSTSQHKSAHDSPTSQPASTSVG